MHIVDEHARVSRPDSCASLVGRRQVVCSIEREVEYKFSSLDLLLFDSTHPLNTTVSMLVPFSLFILISSSLMMISSMVLVPLEYPDLPSLGLTDMLVNVTKPAHSMSASQWSQLCNKLESALVDTCNSKIRRLRKAEKHCHAFTGETREECVEEVLDGRLHPRKAIDPSYIPHTYLQSCRAYEAVNVTCPEWVEEGHPLAVLLPSAHLAKQTNWTACSAQNVWTDFFRCPTDKKLTYSEEFQIVVTALQNAPYPMYSYRTINGTSVAKITTVCITPVNTTCPSSSDVEDLLSSQYLPAPPAAIEVDPNNRPVQQTVVKYV